MRIEHDQPFFIAGTGRVAAAITGALRRTGLTLGAIGGRNRQAAHALATEYAVRGFSLEELREVWPGRGHLLICVSDDAIETVGGMLSGRSSDASAFVVHTSGLHSSGILAKACGVNMRPLALHPVTSFAVQRSDAFEGVLSTVEGCERARAFGRWLARKLGGAAVDVSREQKVSIHAASALFANMTVVLADAFDRITTEAGLDEAAARMLRQQLLDSVRVNLEHASPEAALTGPIARGDSGTVLQHLMTLQAVDARLEAVYARLGLLALDIVRRKGDLGDEPLNELNRILNGRIG